MIVRKKDWLALQERISKLEKGNETLADVVNQNAFLMADNYKEAKEASKNLRMFRDSVLTLRATVFAALGKIKESFSDYNIYTPAEIDKMSSSDYAHKVLDPLGIKMSSDVKLY
jgi:hypothetical protein